VFEQEPLAGRWAAAVVTGDLLKTLSVIVG